MLVACVDIGSSVGWSIDIERSSTNPYTILYQFLKENNLKMRPTVKSSWSTLKSNRMAYRKKYLAKCQE